MHVCKVSSVYINGESQRESKMWRERENGAGWGGGVKNGRVELKEEVMREGDGGKRGSQ
jgi:hypothetical protein